MSGISGIVPILLTPFRQDGKIDFESLRREVDMSLDAGVHGIGIAIGSEIFKLTHAERLQMLGAVADQVAGAVPLVMNTSAPGTQVAVQLAVEAAEAGATRLMIWPPDFFPTGPDSVIAHLKRIAAEAGLPIVLQDVPQSPISPALARRIANEVPLVDTIKVATQPTVGQVDAMVREVGDRLTILGTMPFASQSHDFMAVWAALQEGNEAEAEQIIERRILPISRLGFQGRDLFYHVHKALLLRKKTFKTANVRMPTAIPDAITRSEIDSLLDRLEGEIL